VEIAENGLWNMESLKTRDSAFSTLWGHKVENTVCQKIVYFVQRFYFKLMRLCVFHFMPPCTCSVFYLRNNSWA
jgi:trehalose utilization protein